MAANEREVPSSYVLDTAATPNRLTPIDFARATEGMIYEKNIRIPTRDGSYVMINVFRPTGSDLVPALFCVSAYSKDLHVQDGYPELWANMQTQIPNLREGSTMSFHTHETIDPERWVPWGYACVRMDVPGIGKSPGMFDPWSPTEALATYDAIEWIARQPWCNGKVGMTGISYLATIQWRTASEQPPHLAAICPWEGFADYYRDFNRHGGIMSTFFQAWIGMQVMPVQHGNGASPLRDLDDNSPIGGPVALSEEVLSANRISPMHELRKRELEDEWWRGRSADFSKITVPLLSSGNWGGQGLHLRGNIEGFCQSKSSEKWLEVHGHNHRDDYYLPRGEALQKQFFDCFLKEIDNGWKKRSPLLLNIRQADDTYVEREEQEWPLARTQWTKFYLQTDGNSLATEPASETAIIAYSPDKDGLRFKITPFRAKTEITGPLALKLFVSSSTADMDVHATLRLLRPDGTEATFHGSAEPLVPLAQGWLRASHRKLDAKLSKPWRPWHTHDELQELMLNEVYELDIEIQPTCIVIPEGYQLELLIEGHDFIRPTVEREQSYAELRRRFTEAAGDGNDRSGLFSGSGLFLHNDKIDKTPDLLNGTNTIHLGGAYNSYLLLPVIP